MDIKSIREKFPQYEDLSDEALVNGLRSKFYSDIPIDEFYNKVGFKTTKKEAPPIPVGPTNAGFSAKDTGIALGQGIVGAGKSITDAIKKHQNHFTDTCTHQFII